jgi:predicted heme/steroid binding protein
LIIPINFRLRLMKPECSPHQNYPHTTNPAYVAINGTVYDMTNVAAWAAATHFGLTAGRDLTNEFASCHAGQQILNKLKVVGRMSQ